MLLLKHAPDTAWRSRRRLAHPWVGRGDWGRAALWWRAAGRGISPKGLSSKAPGRNNAGPPPYPPLPAICWLFRTTWKTNHAKKPLRKILMWILEFRNFDTHFPLWIWQQKAMSSTGFCLKKGVRFETKFCHVNHKLRRWCTNSNEVESIYKLMKILSFQDPSQSLAYKLHFNRKDC